MESAESDLMGSSLKEAPIEALMHSDVPKSNVLGVEHVIPRVGGEYQVEIPFMTEEMMEAERLKLLTNPAESEIAGDSLSFLMGLPVQIAWVKEGYNVEAEGLDSPNIPDDVSILKRSLEARKRLKMHKRPRKKNSELNTNSLQSRLSQGDDSRPTSLKMLLLKERQSYQPLKSERCSLVPDSFKRPWSDDEADSFLLGLYIFGKNFNHVKKFMDHKSIGEILSFYYGIFYRSDEYFRWWSCQKSRKRKCIVGDKIFRGWRQRELSSRIILHVQEELLTTLYEGYRSFAEGRTSLDDYVSFLKSTVAVPVLVEAVGIGKGEKDLTGFPIEPEKNNQENPGDPTPRVPNGKAFASLTFTEIVNLLTGGTRLSKARCIDIFWEAVWPRLLANGWHSEQPRDRGYVSSENYLVFLMPGIKKYSKRKLTKGDHYLDSVSDVLHKVTSEPKLIQLEAEKDVVGNEGESPPEVTSDQEDEACFQRPCYLKPRVPKIISDNTKFTVIDTSLARGGKSCGVMEMRNLPGEVNTSSTEQSDSSSDSEGESSEHKLTPNEYQISITQRGEMPMRKKKSKNGGRYTVGESSEHKLIPNYYQNGITQRGELPIKKKMAKNGGSDPNRYTVVDTSLVFGGKASAVREITCLRTVDKCVLKTRRTSWETEAISSEDLPSKGKPDATDSSLNAEMNNSNIDYLDGTLATTQNVESHWDQKTSMTDDKQPKGRSSTSNHSNSSNPRIKRRKLTSCVKAETSSLDEKCSQEWMSGQVKQEGLHGTLVDLNSGTLVVDLRGPKHEASSSREAGDSLEDESSSESRSGDYSGMQTSQTHTSSDRSQPQDFVNRTVSDPNETNADNSGLSFNQRKPLDDPSGTSNVNSRRQSSRTRPLTTKAMECLANGYLSIRTRQKKVVGRRDNSLSRRPSRKPHKPRNIEEASSSPPPETVKETMASKEEIKVDETCNANEDAVMKPLDQMADKWLTGY